MTKSWPALQKIKGKRVYARPGMTTDSSPPNVKDAHNLRFQGVRGGRVYILKLNLPFSSFRFVLMICGRYADAQKAKVPCAFFLDMCIGRLRSLWLVLKEEYTTSHKVEMSLRAALNPNLT